jgi:serine/threonine-protein kinase OSR1/STK39
MKNYNHPNVLPLYCSFVSDSDLWMVMPFISGGSVLHIMKYAHSDGLDEVLIATIMRDVLKALEYVHKQGGIHRDIKVRSTVLLAEGTEPLHHSCHAAKASGSRVA